MFRSAHVLLTVIGMLLCPVTCLQIGTAAKAETAAAGACGCDEHDGHPDEGAGQSDPVTGCKAHGCICCGAVQTRSVVLDDLSVDAVFDAYAVLPRMSQVAAEDLFRFDRGPPYPALASGREVRLFLASLLI